MANGNGIEIEIEILVATYFFLALGAALHLVYVFCLLFMCGWACLWPQFEWASVFDWALHFYGLRHSVPFAISSNVWTVLLFIVWLLDEHLLKMFYGPCAKFSLSFVGIHQSSMAVAAFQVKCAFNTFYGFLHLYTYTFFWHIRSWTAKKLSTTKST